MVNGEGSGVNGLSQAAIGRAMDLSPAAITKLKQQGMPVDSVESALAWRMARQNVAARKALPPAVQHMAPPRQPVVLSNDESHDQARTRREIAEANLAELKLAELQGDLVRAGAVRTAIAKRAAALREALLQMPSRLVPILAADPDPGRMDQALRAEIVAALQHISSGD
jgi:phage terminase Nu1 subunit (DNA packaging protein)